MDDIDMTDLSDLDVQIITIHLVPDDTGGDDLRLIVDHKGINTYQALGMLNVAYKLVENDVTGLTDTPDPYAEGEEDEE